MVEFQIKIKYTLFITVMALVDFERGVLLGNEDVYTVAGVCGAWSR